LILGPTVSLLPIDSSLVALADAGAVVIDAGTTRAMDGRAEAGTAGYAFADGTDLVSAEASRRPKNFSDFSMESPG
jgi:hypothetical protein